MRSIRIMTPAFELGGEIARYTSLRITRRHFGTGEFELHIPDVTRNVGQIEQGSRLFMVSDRQKMLVVEDLEYREAAGEWIFRGYTLDGLVRHRVCVPPRASDNSFGWDRPPEGDAETVFQHFIAGNLVSPEDPGRAIPRLALAENRHRGMQGVYWQARFDEMPQLLQELGEYTDLGWDIRPDFENQQYVFDVVPGRDLSVGNPGITHVIVSLRMGNAGDMVHTMTTSTLRNVAYTGGEGEDERRLILAVGEGYTGEDRREMWVDGGSVDTLSELDMIAKRKMKEKDREERITGTVQSSGVFVFGRDWDVGDIVTLQMKTGTTNARIIEATESYETGKPVDVSIVAGDSPVTLTAAMEKRYGGIVR